MILFSFQIDLAIMRIFIGWAVEYGSDFSSWAGFLRDDALGANLFEDAGTSREHGLRWILGIHRAAFFIGRLDRAIPGIARSVGVLELKVHSTWATEERKVNQGVFSDLLFTNGQESG